MKCRCTAFYSIPNMDGKRCRFAVHPEPALCGREEHKPTPPPEPEWYSTGWLGTGDTFDTLNNDPGDEQP